ncbi:hypothetical protein SY88_17270 [Clostridiales bacterium PH28_bin88]|nr:hypothetical protein SY88_17270 [Clostridiales bacterium PH28_bin88]
MLEGLGIAIGSVLVSIICYIVLGDEPGRQRLTVPAIVFFIGMWFGPPGIAEIFFKASIGNYYCLYMLRS